MVTIYQWHLEVETFGVKWSLQKKVVEAKETPKQYSVLDQGAYFFGYNKTLKKQELETVQSVKFRGLVFSSLEDNDDLAIEKLSQLAKEQQQAKIQKLNGLISQQEQLLALLDEDLELVVK